MKYEMVGCDILAKEKIILVYKTSYISPELKAEKEKQGWKILEGGEKRDSRSPSFPLQSSPTTTKVTA